MSLAVFLSPDAFSCDNPVGFWLLFGGLLLVSSWFLIIAIYRLYFHPLARYHGPKLRAVSQLPFAVTLWKGTFAHDVKALHDKYGEVVRIAPNYLSFIHPNAWQDIYNYNIDSPHFTKDLINYPQPVSGVPSIQTADDTSWTLHRRLLSYGFSDKALREHQVPLLQSYITMLIDMLYKQIHGPSNGKVDIMRWLNFTTFDLTADLTFGESLRCLEKNEYHPWVAMVFASVKAAVILNSTRQFPTFNAVLLRLIPKSLRQKAIDHFNLCVLWTNRCLVTSKDRPDLVKLLQKNLGERSLSIDEIYSDVPILLLGGSETSATVLSACIYYLCDHPQVMEKVRSEFQESIKTGDDITLSRVSKLEYMTAVLNETMRVFTPVPGYLARVSPKGGAFVASHFVPEGTNVSITGWAVANSAQNFREPGSFLPERWLESNLAFASDRKDAHQPFSVGPRNCIGKNLAWAEMRLILSQLLWNFNFELCEESKNWTTNQKTYVLWEKPPLRVKLSPRQENRDI